MKFRSLGTWILLAVAALATAALLCFRQLAQELVYPVERLHMLVARKWFRNPEVETLKRENAAMAVAMGEISDLLAENARLRAALGYAGRAGRDYVPAEVLSSGGAAAGARHTVRTGKGSLDGVAEGAVAVTPSGLAGLVTSTSPHTSEITLITDPALKVSVYVELPGGERANAILAGGSGGNLHLKYLKENGDRLAPHSRVFTSGLGGVFPGGLEIGSLISRDGDVLPAVDFSSLEDVFIRREK